MMRAVAFLIIGLAFGGGIGFWLGADQPAMDHDLTVGEVDHSAHNHETVVSVPAGPGAPGLKLSVVKDPETGWNLHIQTRNFTFAAANAGATHKDGEGHAHLYINGEKRARVYGDWFHIAALPAGQVQVSVSLNTNDHHALAVDGVPLIETLLIENR